MDKFKYLAKNTLVLGISQFSSKVIVFLLLPLYTAQMTTEEYGIADLIVSTIGLLMPIFTLQMTGAVMRFAIEDNSKGERHFSLGTRVILVGFLALLACAPVLWMLDLFNDYILYFYLLYLTNALYNHFGQYARALDRIMLVGVIGVINTVVIVAANILFLVYFDLGILGYLYSYILGYTVGILLFVIFLWKKCTLRPFPEDRTMGKEMLAYSIPLVPNSVSWWAVSSANKYIIQGFISSSVLGLYSVAYKIPTILNTVQDILSQALGLSILKEYDSEEKDETFFSLLYNSYHFVIIFITSCVILATKLLAMLFFANEFFDAWIYVPLLCIPSVWGGMAGYLGSFYSAAKRNNGMFFSTVMGGVITIVFSLCTIRTWGVYGVLWGNVLSYFCIWLYRWLDVKRIVNIKVNLFKDAASWVLLILQALSMMYIQNPFIAYGLGAVFVALHVAMRYRVVLALFGILKKKIKA